MRPWGHSLWHIWAFCEWLPSLGIIWDVVWTQLCQLVNDPSSCCRENDFLEVFRRSLGVALGNAVVYWDYGAAGLMVGPDELEGLFQQWWFCDLKDWTWPPHLELVDPPPLLSDTAQVLLLGRIFLSSISGSSSCFPQHQRWLCLLPWCLAKYSLKALLAKGWCHLKLPVIKTAN